MGDLRDRLRQVVAGFSQVAGSVCCGALVQVRLLPIKVPTANRDKVGEGTGGSHAVAGNVHDCLLGGSRSLPVLPPSLLWPASSPTRLTRSAGHAEAAIRNRDASTHFSSATCMCANMGAKVLSMVTV